MASVKLQNEVEMKRFIASGDDFGMSRTPEGASTNFPHVLVFHSPDGFEWGYAGSGPAETALNILFLVTGDSTLAWLYHQDYKFDVVGNIPGEGGIIRREEVIEWLKDHDASWARRASAGEGAYGS
jgi:hypothetical protein